MLRPKLFIDGQEVDLYEDERIQFDLNLKDFKQFDKTFGSYTQPFTVPASKTNNKIFEHYYNASVNTSYNPNVSLSAVLEINNIPYKTGFVKVEKASVKNGEVNNYQIVFYDTITGLKEALGDDRLHDIGWTYDMDVSARFDSFSDTHNFTSISLRNAAFTPLIGAHKFLRYTKDANDDFDRNTTRLLINETRPAVSVKYILDQIKTNYNLDITYPIDKIGNPDGSSTTDAEGCLYLWCNREEGILRGLKKYWHKMETYAVSDPDGRWDGNTHTVSIDASGEPNHIAIYQFIMDIPTNAAQVDDWNAEVCAYRVDTGEILDIKKLSKQNPKNTLFVIPPATGSFPVSFYFRTSDPIWLGSYISSFNDVPNVRLLDGISTEMVVAFDNTFVGPNKVDFFSAMTFCNTTYTSLGETYSVDGQLPSIKVFDFLLGLAKMFNWVLVSDGDSYTFKTLDAFYADGVEKDWTEYVDQLNYETSKVDFFGEIKFLYEPNESILSDQYYNTVGGGEYGYGDLVTTIQDTNGDLISSDTYEVKAPFTKLIWEKPVTSEGNPKNFYIANAVDAENKATKTAPVLMYYNGRVTINDGDTLKLNYQNNNTSEEDITQVHVASDRSDLTTSFNQSLNFGTEINLETNTSDASSSNTLYKVFYEDLITDLYDLNARFYSFDAVLPIGEVLNINLSDTIKIGFTKYFINSINVDLTTGKAKLNLRNVIE